MDSDSRETRPEGRVAVIAITRNGAGLALRLQAKLPGSDCFVPSRHDFAIAMGASGYERLGSLFPGIWAGYRSIICIMATGIVVRLIAPLLRHKTVDPAVVVLDERGSYAISLLSGHLGGANRLAGKVAGIVGGQAVITTASDVSEKPALDLMAAEAGLEVENAEMLGRLARALLEDEAVWVFDPQGRLDAYLADQPNVFPLTMEELGEFIDREGPESFSGTGGEPAGLSGAAEPDFESKATHPDFEGNTAEPDSEGNTAKPDFEGNTTEPDFGSSTAEPDFGSRAAEPYFGSSTAEFTPSQCAERVPPFSKGGMGGISDGRSRWKIPPDPPLKKWGDEIAQGVEGSLIDADRTPGIWVSERLAPKPLQCLVLRPLNLVVGIGCNRGTPVREILDFLSTVFERHGLSMLSIRNLVSVDLKSDEQAILEAAKAIRRPVHFHSRHEIENISVPNPSEVVAAHIGVNSVCEATALLSAQTGTLLIPKRKTANVTLAVARVAFP